MVGAGVPPCPGKVEIGVVAIVGPGVSGAGVGTVSGTKSGGHAVGSDVSGSGVPCPGNVDVGVGANVGTFVLGAGVTGAGVGTVSGTKSGGQVG
jgi:hypothetical protein